MKTKTDHNCTAEIPLQLQMLLLYFLIHNILQPPFSSKSICLHKWNIFHAANFNKWNITVNYNSLIINYNYSKIKHQVPNDLEPLPGLFGSSISVFIFMHVFKEATSFFPLQLQTFSHSTFFTKSQAALMVKFCFLKISSHEPYVPDWVTSAI